MSSACFKTGCGTCRSEELDLLALDSQSQVLREVLVTRGLLNRSLVHPREVFRAAIAAGGACCTCRRNTMSPLPETAS